MAAKKKSSFISHLLMWILLSFLVEALVLPAIISPKKENQRVRSEMAINHAFMGEGSDAIAKKATRTFNAAFVETGAVTWSANFLGQSSTLNVFGVEKTYASFSNRWLTSFWLAVYLFFYRVFNILYWLTPALFFITAAAIDGFAIWRIKKREFGVADPIKFRFASHAIAHSIGGTLFLGFFPFIVPPIVWPVAVAIIASTVWVAAANFQSGLSGMDN